MTKKDFILVARALRDAFPTDAAATARGTWEQTVSEMARALRGTNQNFNWQRFVDACHE